MKPFLVHDIDLARLLKWANGSLVPVVDPEPFVSMRRDREDRLRKGARGRKLEVFHSRPPLNWEEVPAQHEY